MKHPDKTFQIKIESDGHPTIDDPRAHAAIVSVASEVTPGSDMLSCKTVLQGCVACTGMILAEIIKHFLAREPGAARILIEAIIASGAVKGKEITPAEFTKEMLSEGPSHQYNN